MPITFTNGLEPVFSADSFNSEKEHVKRIFVLLENGTAFENILETPLNNLVTRIDLLTTQLETDYNSAEGDKPTLEAYTVIPIDPNTGQQEVDPNTGELVTNLPDGWATAGFIASDISSIVSAINGYQTENQLIRTNLTILKTFITTADDTFKLHNDLLSGVREDPPQANVKPTLRGLMGTVGALHTLENSFGVPFVNYLEKVFGTLFTGDLTISNAQTFLNTNPIPVTYASLNVVTNVNEDPLIETPTTILAGINGLLSGSTYSTTVLTHKDNLQTHITNDTNEYNIVVDKLDRLIQSFGISGHIREDYYKFMYTDVFGSAGIKQIINDRDTGAIE